MGWIYEREGSKYYWMAYHDADGKLVRRSAKTTDKLLAEQKLAEMESQVIAKTAKGGISGQEDSVGQEAPPSATNLEKRVSALEVLVRRLYLYHSFQARMFQFWGRHAERLLPSEPKFSDMDFFQDLSEEGKGQ